MFAANGFAAYRWPLYGHLRGSHGDTVEYDPKGGGEGRFNSFLSSSASEYKLQQVYCDSTANPMGVIFD